MFKQLSHGLHCSQKQFYSVPFLGILSLFFFFSFSMDSTLPFNSCSPTVSLRGFSLWCFCCTHSLTLLWLLYLSDHIWPSPLQALLNISYPSLPSLLFPFFFFHFATSMPLFSLRRKQSTCAALYPPKLVNSKGGGGERCGGWWEVRVL